MSDLGPDYGSTPLDFEELDALLPSVTQVLGEHPSKAAVFELEQAYETAVREALVPRAADGDLSLADLITDWFLRDLHGRLYEHIWSWAGKPRTREVSIGVAPECIAVELHTSFENLLYRWEHTQDWTAAQLALATHAEAVRVHPFVDGNGRSTRLLADLVLLAAQGEDAPPAVFDWEVSKADYIAALRRFDHSRDPAGVAGLISTVKFSDG